MIHDRAASIVGPSAAGRPVAAGPSEGKRTLTEAVVRGGGAGAAAAAQASVDPAAALALGMRGEERPVPYRAALAAQLGIPLDRVRCFFGSAAQLACAQVQAEAFTVGNVIVFGCESPSLELVKHELAHVAQQAGHAAGELAIPPSSLAMTAPDDAHERAADAHEHAADATGGVAATAGGPAAHVLARYFATNAPVTLYAGRHAQQPLQVLALGVRVAKLYDPNDPGDGWVEVRVTHGGPLEATGYVQDAQLDEHADTATVDYNKALQLYGELANGRFDTVGGGRLPIPFGYSAKGCQARAQAMAQLLSEKGYQSQKIFAVAERNVLPAQNKGALTSQTSLGEPTRWPFHVAPLLRVTHGNDEYLMVLDPALPGGRPLTVTEWMTAIGAPQFQARALDDVEQAIAIHDQNQINVAPVDRTILPTGQQPFWFRAPSNVYDFMTLSPQTNNEQGEHRMLMEGAPDLEQQHGLLQQKRAVLHAIGARDLVQTLHALGQLDRAERLRLLTVPLFDQWLSAMFQGGYGQVIQAFRA